MPRKKSEVVLPPSEAEWKPLFLAALRETANVRSSCRAAGVGRRTAYELRERDKEFAAAWDAALEDACDLLEERARKRAMKDSDTLMIFLLKAHRPAKYRERYEVSGPDGGPMRVAWDAFAVPPGPVPDTVADALSAAEREELP